MTTLRMTVHEDAPEWVISDCMDVMTRAFDPQFGEAWTAAQTRSMMTMPGTRLVIGRLGDTPVGFALVRTVLDETELMLLAVAPDHRRQGYGQYLLDRTINLAESLGCTRCLLEVRDGNPARQLYLASGFEEYSIRKNYYRGGNGQVFDAISFSISLNQGKSLL
jgi:ribosomal-protein-alanine N-acetyltransferase